MLLVVVVAVALVQVLRRIAPVEIRGLRELTRYRMQLVRPRTSCKDQVHAVLAKLGIRLC